MEPNEFHPRSLQQWRAWLRVNHRKAKNIWLVLHKKSSPGPGIDYVQAVEEALCFGWIDSKPQKKDNHTYLLYFAERKAGSIWSKLNKERITRLIKEGRMTSYGLKKIEAAKADGTWSTLDPVDMLQVPEDLGRAFAKNKKAWKNFEAFPPGIKKQLVYWVLSAKRAETRAARVKEIVAKAARNERANQWVKK
ncbi:MAG: YdeI/OmpD-associated family protein [Cyclobacteriaceae bacterium]|nr:YdeI/OmpD-associated family protein [Cyclobacteriaceae bacterium]